MVRCPPAARSLAITGECVVFRSGVKNLRLTSLCQTTLRLYYYGNRLRKTKKSAHVEKKKRFNHIYSIIMSWEFFAKLITLPTLWKYGNRIHKKTKNNLIKKNRNVLTMFDDVAAEKYSKVKVIFFSTYKIQCVPSNTRDRRMYHTQLANLSFDEIFKPSNLRSRGWSVFLWEDDRNRYTATIPCHRAVQQNTPRFLTPIRDADWSTQPRTGF